MIFQMRRVLREDDNRFRDSWRTIVKRQTVGGKRFLVLCTRGIFRTGMVWRGKAVRSEERPRGE